MIWLNAPINGSEKLNYFPKVAQRDRRKGRIWTSGPLPSTALKDRKWASKGKESRGQRSCRRLCQAQGSCTPALWNGAARLSEIHSWTTSSTNWGFAIWGKLPPWGFIYSSIKWGSLRGHCFPPVPRRQNQPGVPTKSMGVWAPFYAAEIQSPEERPNIWIF